MKKLNVSLQNCYGIKKLSHEFDFSKHNIFVVYAPNGSMKSSFALTFKDIAAGTNPKDRVHKTRVSQWRVVDENETMIPQDQVVVLEPYMTPFGDKTNATILLVNSKLREQYERLHTETRQSKDVLLKALKKQSKSKRNLEEEISLSFTGAKGDFYLSLGRLRKELADQGDTPYAEVPYDVVFDEKVLDILKEPNVKAALDTYIEKYNDLISRSIYFRKGTFEYYNAATVAKNLADQGFFKAKHFVTLDGKQQEVITSRTRLEELVEEEKKKITSDATLRSKFDSIDRSLTANVAIRAFRDYILSNEAILSQMSNIQKFKQEVWKSYLKTNMSLYEELVDRRDEAEKKSREIVEEAKKEYTQWQRVMDTFNDRFEIPVKLSVKNRDAVQFANADPILTFECEDDGDKAVIEESELLEILSQGERK